MQSFSYYFSFCDDCLKTIVNHWWVVGHRLGLGFFVLDSDFFLSQAEHFINWKHLAVRLGVWLLLECIFVTLPSNKPEKRLCETRKEWAGTVKASPFHPAHLGGSACYFGSGFCLPCLPIRGRTPGYWLWRPLGNGRFSNMPCTCM